MVEIELERLAVNRLVASERILRYLRRAVIEFQQGQDTHNRWVLDPHSGYCESQLRRITVAIDVRNISRADPIAYSSGSGSGHVQCHELKRDSIVWKSDGEQLTTQPLR